jgi:hypothetical protein
MALFITRNSRCVVPGTKLRRPQNRFAEKHRRADRSKQESERRKQRVVRCRDGRVEGNGGHVRVPNEAYLLEFKFYRSRDAL